MKKLHNHKAHVHSDARAFKGFSRPNHRYVFPLLLALMCLFLLPVSAMAAAPAVKNVEWEGNGRVEVHFLDRTETSNLSIKVTDAAGKKYEASLVERRPKEIEFKVSGLKKGKLYLYTIKGIRKAGSGKYGKVSGSFSVPKAVHGITVKETDVDLKENTVSFEFSQKVQWKNASVSIRLGKQEFVQKILEKDNDEIKVRAKGLVKGTEYTWKITGIRKNGTDTYVSLRGKFKAR